MSETMHFVQPTDQVDSATLAALNTQAQKGIVEQVVQTLRQLQQSGDQAVKDRIVAHEAKHNADVAAINAKLATVEVLAEALGDGELSDIRGFFADLLNDEVVAAAFDAVAVPHGDGHVSLQSVMQALIAVSLAERVDLSYGAGGLPSSAVYTWPNGETATITFTEAVNDATTLVRRGVGTIVFKGVSFPVWCEHGYLKVAGNIAIDGLDGGVSTLTYLPKYRRDLTVDLTGLLTAVDRADPTNPLGGGDDVGGDDAGGDAGGDPVEPDPGETPPADVAAAEPEPTPPPASGGAGGVL